MSTRCAFMSRRPSSNTANSPHGPAPIISTSVLITSLMSLTFSVKPPGQVVGGQNGQRLSIQRSGIRKAIISPPRGNPLRSLDNWAVWTADFRRPDAVNAPVRADAEPHLDDFPYRLS